MVTSKAVIWLLCATASAQNLCSDINTSNSSPNVDIYQSTGQCTTVCNRKYAYVVLQSSSCWCTNYTPDASSQKSGCNIKCPGFPSDTCGGQNLFSYTLVNPDLVLGPKGGSSSSKSESGKTFSPTAISTTVTITPSVATVDGVISTITVVPTSTRTPEPTTSNDSGGLATSAVVGIAFGCLGGLAIIGLCIWFFLVKRKGGDDDNYQQTFMGLSPMRSDIGRASPDSMNNSLDPFADSRVSPFSHSLYSWRNRSGSIEYLPEKEKEGGLRIVNPDPPEKS